MKSHVLIRNASRGGPWYAPPTLLGPGAAPGAPGALPGAPGASPDAPGALPPLPGLPGLPRTPPKLSLALSGLPKLSRTFPGCSRSFMALSQTHPVAPRAAGTPTELSRFSRGSPRRSRGSAGRPRDSQRRFCARHRTLEWLRFGKRPRACALQTQHEVAPPLAYARLISSS